MRIALTVALLSACSPCLADGAVRAIGGRGSDRWAVGDGGLLLHSDDAGTSWRAAAVGAAGDFTAVHFDSETAGHIFGGSPVPGHPGGATAGVVLRTEDGGATWKPLPVVPPAHLHGGWMHGLRGMAFGRPSGREPAGLWATVTDGRQWISLKAAGAGTLLGGDAAGAANACMVGSAHRIVHLHRLEELTTGEAPLESGAALTAVAMAGVNAIWAVGENGSALRYSGPSAGWQVLPLPLPVGTRRLADLEAVAAGGEGEALLAGGLAGAIFHSDDAGRSFQRHRAPGPGPIHALHRDSDGVLLAGGDGGRIFRSTDAGRNWQRVHGAESIDVLLIAAPADVTSLAALAAHAASGLSTAVLVPALPVGPHGLRGDVPLASAAAALGAEGGYVLTDFLSVAGDPAADRLTEQQILQRWSASLDVPAGAEMRRQIAAAVRLYRPAVVVLGPDGYERRGPAAECRLVSRIAAEAVELAADAGALPELAEAGLKPWRVRRTFTGLEENARYTPPWDKPPDRPRNNVAAAFIGWRYPAGGSTSLSMTADAAGWRLPWLDPADRPARVTAFRCSEVLTQPVALFTQGLSPKPLRLRSDPPVGDAIASGALLRGAGLVGRNVAVAAGPLAAAARDHGDDPLPAEMLRSLREHLLARGRLAEAADVNRTLLSVGAAHPLHGRISVASVAMAASAEWRGQLLRFGPGPSHGAAAQAPRFEDVIARLTEPRWRAWSQDEYGTMLLGKAYAFVGDLDHSRAAYAQLAESARTVPWRQVGRVELAALQGAAHALAAGSGLLAHAAAGDLKLDGRADEPFWKRARAITLTGPGPGAASARLVSLPKGLAVGIELAAGGDPGEDVPWSLRLAVDADRDGWTQWVMACDSSAARSLQLRTHLAPAARVDPKVVGLEARRTDAGWSIEVLMPHGLMGTSAGRTELIRVQIEVVPGDDADAAPLRLKGQDDGRLLPHRYALLALPATAGGGLEEPPDRPDQ